MKENNKKINTCKESSTAFNGMFCTKYRVFKLLIKNKTLRFALQYNKFVTLFVKT